MNSFLIVLIGAVTGVISAVLGVGGAVIMLPATQYLMGLDLVMSIGTTLFAVIFTSISGALGHLRRGNIKPRMAALLGTGGITGVLLGSYVFKEYFSKHVFLLELLLGTLFFFMALRMGKESVSAWKTRNNKNNDLPASKKMPDYMAIGVGLLTGTITGILGLGGGFLMVPALIWFFAVAPYEAVGTTLLAMVPIALFGGLAKVYHGYVDLTVGVLLGLGAIGGTQLGAYISTRIKPYVFKLFFTVIFSYLTINYLLL